MALSKIQAESINLADTFAFTGTVTGNSMDKLFAGSFQVMLMNMILVQHI